MYACNPDEAAQTPILTRTLHQTYIINNFPNITLHQTLFRAAKVHARISAKDQTVFNTIPSNEGEVTPVRLKPAAPRSRVKHSTTEPLRSLTLTSTCTK